MAKIFTLELNRHHYGFLAEDQDECGVTAPEQVLETTDDKLQGIIYSHENDLKLVESIWELDLTKTTLEKGIRRIKNFAKSAGVESTRVKVKYLYCGVANRY